MVWCILQTIKTSVTYQMTTHWPPAFSMFLNDHLSPISKKEKKKWKLLRICRSFLSLWQTEGFLLWEVGFAYYWKCFWDFKSTFILEPCWSAGYSLHAGFYYCLWKIRVVANRNHFSSQCVNYTRENAWYFSEF